MVAKKIEWNKIVWRITKIEKNKKIKMDWVKWVGQTWVKLLFGNFFWIKSEWKKLIQTLKIQRPPSNFNSLNSY